MQLVYTLGSKVIISKQVRQSPLPIILKCRQLLTCIQTIKFVQLQIYGKQGYCFQMSENLVIATANFPHKLNMMTLYEFFFFRKKEDIV